MTVTEQLKRRLDALPPKLREAEAARLLSDLQERTHEGREQAKASAEDDRSHPLPGVERVPFERIKHLAGIAKEGPSDLATNPKYLDDLGQSSMR